MLPLLLILNISSAENCITSCIRSYYFPTSSFVYSALLFHMDNFGGYTILQVCVFLLISLSPNCMLKGFVEKTKQVMLTILDILKIPLNSICNQKLFQVMTKTSKYEYNLKGYLCLQSHVVNT